MLWYISHYPLSFVACSIAVFTTSQSVQLCHWDQTTIRAQFLIRVKPYIGINFATMPTDADIQVRALEDSVVAKTAEPRVSVSDGRPVYPSEQKGPAGVGLTLTNTLDGRPSNAPTDAELAGPEALRRISAPIPWPVYTIAFVELCERFSYYGTTIVCMYSSIFTKVIQSMEGLVHVLAAKVD